jgi:para-nitrobenzyl esterase
MYWSHVHRFSQGVLCAFLLLGLSSCDEQATDAKCEKDGADADIQDIDVQDIPLTVKTTYGPVKGTVGDSSRVFRAIRYAAPPVGPLRFAAPRPPERWKQAPEPVSTACPQYLDDGSFFGTEDCLILDVWTPVHAPARSLPVMVWIHGGGYTAGSGYMTDALLPSRDVVLVAINYRLGALGFLAHPALTAEGGGTSGNYGIEDQRMALEWVRDNISAFGGDPKVVTIFGESAGGSAVGAHLWSERSAGLFHRAIMQSGIGFIDGKRTLAQSESQGERFAAAVSCDTSPSVLECLRALPVEKVLGVVGSYRPSFDGVVFERTSVEKLADGSFNRVPTIIGSNTLEGLGFLSEQSELTAEGYVSYLKSSSSYADHADEILSVYPAANFATPQLALAAVMGNARFNCPARRAVRALSQAGVDAYLYLFGQGYAFHAADLDYIFGIGAWPSDQKVSSAMKDYWTQFAKTGDPNINRQPKWPRYQIDTDPYLYIADPIVEGSQLLRQECDFWDSLE